MARIRVTPDQVRQVGGQFKQASTQSQEMVTRLQNTMTQLSPEWEGMSQQRFFQQYEQWRTSMNNYVQMLQQISQELEAIAVRFEQADQTK
jgi:WXG100 family type VII secretion target